MRSTECSFNADQCGQLAREVAAKHRDLLLDLAKKWRDATNDLQTLEQRSGDEQADSARRSEL
jgi:hypothetical protein